MNPPVVGGVGPLALSPRVHAYNSYLTPPSYHCRHSGYCNGALHHHENNCACAESSGDKICNRQADNTRVKMKDVTIRGKARPVRASYLTEAPKFEADIVKYMEKKKESDVPDRVVDLLLQFINREHYDNSNLLDEVTICILASNVGAKSALEHSVGRLKKLEEDIHLRIDPNNIVDIIGCILLSSKVDAKVTDWLKNFLGQLGEKMDLREIFYSRKYLELDEEHPEVYVAVSQMMGWRVSGDRVDKKFRQL